MAIHCDWSGFLFLATFLDKDHLQNLIQILRWLWTGNIMMFLYFRNIWTRNSSYRECKIFKGIMNDQFRENWTSEQPKPAVITKRKYIPNATAKISRNQGLIWHCSCNVPNSMPRPDCVETILCRTNLAILR